MDAVKLLLVFFAMIIPWVIAQLWWWVWFWVAIAVVLMIAELASYIATKRTISQQFWKWKDNAPKWQRGLILAGMLIFWGYLIAHLYLKW